MSGAALVAALPMYDFEETAAANDALWAHMAKSLRACGIEAPDELVRGAGAEALWRHPGLLFGQTCGYPYVTALRDAVALIATPEYAFPGCEGANHRSFIIARADDERRELGAFHGSVGAVNSFDSNTGMNLFRAAIAPHAKGARFFARVVVTGAHAASLAAVRQGRADLSAIDCVTFGLLGRHRPELVAGVKIVEETSPSPGLPFIASARVPIATVAAVREALFAALAAPALESARTVLGVSGARVLTAPHYRQIAVIEQQSKAARYPNLC